MSSITVVRLTPTNFLRAARAACGLVALVAALAATGCTADKAAVPSGDAAENLRNLVLAYVQYAAAHGGKGPPDQATLAKAVVQRLQISEAEAADKFKSLRDNQPYVIKWGAAPMGPLDADGNPTVAILIYESQGANVTRYVANGRASVYELNEADFALAVPDAAVPAG